MIMNAKKKEVNDRHEQVPCLRAQAGKQTHFFHETVRPTIPWFHRPELLSLVLLVCIVRTQRLPAAQSAYTNMCIGGLYQSQHH